MLPSPNSILSAERCLCENSGWPNCLTASTFFQLQGGVSNGESLIGFNRGTDRNQVMLFPESVEDYITEETRCGSPMRSCL